MFSWRFDRKLGEGKKMKKASGSADAPPFFLDKGKKERYD